MPQDRIAIPLRLAPELHAKLRAMADEDQRSLNAFISLALSRFVNQRVPLAAAPKPEPLRFAPKIRKVGANERCPCGSGNKYKKCHGRANSVSGSKNSTA